MSYQRISSLRAALLAACAGVVVLACSSAPAFADIVNVNPRVSGSGTVSSTGGNCTAANKPNGALTTGCTDAIGISSLTPPAIFPAQITLAATPQATPTGHWSFVRWDSNAPGCAGSTAPTCVVIAFTAAGYFATAVFEDHTGPAITTGPAVTYSTSSDRTVTVNWAANEATSGFTCSLDNAATFSACPNGAQTLTLAEGAHTFRVRGTDISGNLGAISTQLNFRILDTALVSGPADVSNDKSPTFVFSSLTGLNFECAVDNVVLAACGSKNPADNRGSKALANLSEGTHTFRVRAIDGPEFDRVPVVRTWKVDTVAPVAALDAGSGPGQGALQAVNKETFNFTANEAGTFECRLDSAGFAPCASGFVVDRLTAGPHRFEVRAIDLAGNVGAVSARDWSVAASDNDNDGFNALIDCNDGDPAIRPGAIEVPDNAVDENCDGLVGATPVVFNANARPATEQVIVTLAFFSTAGKRTTKFTTLQVKNVPLGATVNVTCKGKGCPSGLKGMGFTKKNAFGTVTLAKFIKKPLKAKDVITVVVSKPNAISAIKVLTVRAAKKPVITTKCQPPGAKSAVAC